MKLRNLLLLLFVLGVIGGAAGLSYFYKSIPNVTKIEQYTNEAFLATQEADARVNEAVLRSRQSLDVSYDYLTSQSEKLQSAVNTLANTEKHFALNIGTINSQSKKLVVLVDKKLGEVEQFKSHNAVLKNSLRYTPIVGERLIELANEQGESSLSLSYGKVVRDLQRFALTADNDLSAPIKQSMQSLIALEQPISDIALTDQIEFANHATVTLAEVSQTDQLVSGIINAKTKSSLNQLNKDWLGWLDSQKAKRSQFTLYTIVYIAFLLLGLIAILWWLRRLYVSLDRRVAERTRELSVAYDDLKTSQLRLVQSEKMAVLGQMIAGIAHEVNTPLGYVKSNIELSQENFQDYDELLQLSGKLSKDLKSSSSTESEIEQGMTKLTNIADELLANEVSVENKQLFEDSLFGIEQIAELVTDLKNFARLDESNIQKVNIKTCIDTSLNIAKNNIKQYNIVKNYQNVDLPKVECSPSQINQVLLNLLNNAAYAVDLAKGAIGVSAGVSDNYVYVQIIDNGAGMDEKTLANIFEPFFTTKGAGKGTGLGLAISKQIIEQHNGKIQVFSKVGRGTMFRISLPINNVSSG